MTKTPNAKNQEISKLISDSEQSLGRLRQGNMPMLQGSISKEFLEYDPSYFGDLMANVDSYSNSFVGSREMFSLDSCYETKLEKEYLQLEKHNFHERAKQIALMKY